MFGTTGYFNKAPEDIGTSNRNMKGNETQNTWNWNTKYLELEHKILGIETQNTFNWNTKY